MKPTAILLLLSLVGLCQPASAQTDPCKNRLQSYIDGDYVKPGLQQLKAANGKGAVQYYGAIHSSNPSDTQFVVIDAAWKQFSPTIAFFEGPNRGTDSTANATISRLGESGYLRFLAGKGGIKAQSLENPMAEYEAMVQQFGEEKTELFYVLREANRLQTRKGMDSSAVAAQTAKLLTQMGSRRSTPLPYTTVAGIDSAYRNYWTTGSWWQTPTQWFEPGKSGQATGGLFTNAVNTASSEFRNGYMYEVITAAVRRGERVFVVVGKDHVPRQLPAVRCSLESIM